MPESVDTPAAASVARLIGIDISFFAGIAQQTPDTQQRVWEALQCGCSIFQQTKDTDAAHRSFTDLLAESGISIAPGLSDKLTPAAREALLTQVDARDTVERFAAMNGAQRASLMVFLSDEQAAAGHPESEDYFEGIRWFSTVAFGLLCGGLEDLRELGLTPASVAEIRDLTRRIEQIASNADSQRQEWHEEEARRYMADHRQAAGIADILRQLPPAKRAALLDGFRALAGVLRDGGTEEEASRALVAAHNAHDGVRELTAGHIAQVLSEIRAGREVQPSAQATEAGTHNA